MNGIRPRGFTLIELLVVISIIALLIGILLPALGEARRSGRLAVSSSNLKQLGVATAGYAADYKDRIPAFTWTGGESYLYASAGGGESVVTPDNDLEAAVFQAVDIIRRRADRPDFSEPSNWIPHVLYTHLVLQDYLAARLPEKLVVNPEDRNRLNWQIDPQDKFDEGFWLPLQPEPSNDNQRWPYSSSYQFVPATYDLGQSVKGDVDRISQGNGHNLYAIPPGVRLGGAKLGDVAQPSGKVQMHDSHARHFGSDQMFYAYRQARQPLLMFDGAVGVRVTQDGNPGWDPTDPTDPQPLKFFYKPEAWEPPALVGQVGGGVWDLMEGGWYRWTRLGLRGIDYGGSEVNSGQR